MKSPSTDRKSTNLPPRPTVREDIKTEQKQAEAKEVQGRHKNSGQKDHKGAR